MEDIADLMLREYMETGRRDLLEYQRLLRQFILLVKVMYVQPKIIKKALEGGEGGQGRK
ncbi:hypothetical protein [Vulcanisaeta thermophila]|uniref:hypothetical protein n=1 Tax=Vulcanisaeta thermophila TaxID=867917 RepID=UPI00138A492F|nr:hypothetical protein [Vulcanisaeta thermophila]